MRHVAIGLVGPGLIGKALLAQLAQQAPYLERELGTKLAVVAVANSRAAALAESPSDSLLAAGGDKGGWAARLEAAAARSGGGSGVDLDALGAHVAAAAAAAQSAGGNGSSNSIGVVVDCTASEAAPDHYEGWLARGLHVVTPNKKWGAGPAARRARGVAAAAAARSGGGGGSGAACVLAEASVGAGLPVLSTLRDLVETGDTILRVEGVLSGTLSYVFNAYKRGGPPFSAVVAGARDAGYTEPDPREDLSGMDVARKVVILARAAGVSVELSDLNVESLVPAALAGGGVTADDFLAKLPEYDGEMATRADAAAATGGVLRYVGVVDAAAKTASVTLKVVPGDHPFAQLSGTDNIIAFTTQRCPSSAPLVVRGPGAGAEVTAAGVFGDILKLIRGG